VRGTGGLLRRVQNGFVRSYAVLIGIGAVVLLALFLSRANL
jgi:xanthine/uracil permease